MSNPLKRSQFIEYEFRKYLESTLKIDDDELNDILVKKLKDTEIYKGPYLSFDKPFKTNISLEKAIEEGLLTKSFAELSDINFKMHLYEHQYKSIKALNNNRSIVITTGTGSGKTESFLFPILNNILKDIDEGKDVKGIRAVFLYPINALVNDQMDRLRKILFNYPKITFGSYTGDTEYTEEKARRNINKDDFPKNEIRSREEMRNNPPMLLFTNYAMLEYILIRPADNAIFNEQNTKNWKFIVLDEAHTYQGAIGIELSNLLRRVSAKFSKGNLQYILTSATLGKDRSNVEEIIDFAHNLTSAHYEIDDIILAERKTYENKAVYYVEINDIKKLLKERDNKEILYEIASKYNVKYSENYEELVFDILYSDEKFHYLLELLKHSSVWKFKDLFIEFSDVFGFDEEELVDYIDLISLADKNENQLLSCKYHVFLRTPNGAYAVLKPKPIIELSITKEINDLKAYEIGSCKYCSSTFIMGNIVDKKELLIQNDDIDIYENYGEDATSKELKKVDFLLVPNKGSEIEGDENLIEYLLCQKCGHLKMIDNLNGLDCECEEKYKIHVFHVIESQDKLINNIKVCPICEGKNNAGVVRAFHIQKDEATSILSQINLKSMSLNGESKVKQFIAFSDSVQQASFYASFLEANHLKFLRKRLIWDILKEQKKLSFKSLTNEIREILENEELIDYSQNAEETLLTEAWITTLTELLKVDGQYSGEGLGLFAFRLKNLTEEKIKDYIKENKSAFINNFSNHQIIDLIHVALEIFRTTPAINYNRADLNRDRLDEELLYRRFDNFVEKIKTDTKSNKFNSVRSYLPASNTKRKALPNGLFKYLSNVFKTSDFILLTNIADWIWKLAINLKILESQKTNENYYQINVSSYEVVHGEEIEWYQCDTCRRITPNNVLSTCPTIGCKGKLKIVDLSKYEGTRSDYYREQYKSKDIERIIVEEHTAQIGKTLGKINQNSFKNKKINVLSSSTTFEMGIDIGSLDNVFLRNVPPTPANYAQRAGRAGRRKGNAGFVLTYCGIGSHDFTYFNQPSKMISGIIRPPHFKISNKKIALRHITASAFGTYFIDKGIYFDTIEPFVFGNGVEDFIDYLKTKPKHLNEYIKKSVLKDTGLDEFYNFGWINNLIEKNSSLNRMVDYLRNEVKELEKAKQEAFNENTNEGSIRSSKYQKQITRIKEAKLISTLSQYIVIPKYGFPVDVVNLLVSDNIVTRQKNKDFDDRNPSRDLSVAISEYAPDSEIVIDKKKIKSKYIRFPFGNFDRIEKKHYYECENCKRIVSGYDLESVVFNSCPYCETKREKSKIYEYIVPSYGFMSDIKEEKTRMLKPKKTFASEIMFMGGGVSNNDKIYLSPSISIESSCDEELLSINRSPFFVCEYCGYSKLIWTHKNAPFFIDKMNHKKSNGYDCSNNKLIQYHLANTVRTDVVKVRAEMMLSYEESISALYAILDGISTTFNIERRDINGIINIDNGTEFIFFDQVPGGAGHVKRIMSKEEFKNVLINSKESMDNDCCDENTSCYSCLRNYYNQRVHDKLKRGLARDTLSIFIKTIESGFKDDGHSLDREDEKEKEILNIGIKSYLKFNQGIKHALTYVLDDYEDLKVDIDSLVVLLSRLGINDSDIFSYNNDITVENIKFNIALLIEKKKVMVHLSKDKINESIVADLTKQGWDLIFVRQMRGVI